MAFAEFLKARRAARSFAQPAADGTVERDGTGASSSPSDDDGPASQERAADDVAPRPVSHS